MWHYSHYSSDEILFASNILSALKARGCKSFPDLSDSLHFDDKVAQAYLLQALGLDAPVNYPLHSMDSVDEWIDKVGNFPIVAKLRTDQAQQRVTHKKQICLKEICNKDV